MATCEVRKQVCLDKIAALLQFYEEGHRYGEIVIKFQDGQVTIIEQRETVKIG